MLIIFDGRLPARVAENLSKHGEIFELHSDGVVYDSISGHPDIFMFQKDNLLIIAPNAPKDLIEVLKKHRIPFLRGKEKLGKSFPETVCYNAVSIGRYLIHRPNYTSKCILRQTTDKEFLAVPQAYTRCNLLPLSDGSFITSDKGIETSLKKHAQEVYYFDSKDILLNGQDHGFLGGAMGLFNSEVFIIGSLDHYSEGEYLKELLNGKSFKFHELYNGPLIDGGGIFFLEA
jgi:hypothetical protein